MEDRIMIGTLCAILGFLIGTPLLFLGFENIDNKRTLLGSLQCFVGFMMGLIGLQLLVFSSSAWSWALLF